VIEIAPWTAFAQAEKVLDDRKLTASVAAILSHSSSNRHHCSLVRVTNPFLQIKRQMCAARGASRHTIDFEHLLVYIFTPFLKEIDQFSSNSCHF
jgi:hypothetical protein